MSPVVFRQRRGGHFACADVETGVRLCTARDISTLLRWLDQNGYPTRVFQLRPVAL